LLGRLRIGTAGHTVEYEQEHEHERERGESISQRPLAKQMPLEEIEGTKRRASLLQRAEHGKVAGTRFGDES
jgi:hypothetical protein